MSATAEEALEALGREGRGRLLALVARRVGDLELADDCLQEAYESALVTWPRTGVPTVPQAWLVTTARRRALDAIRRDAVLARKLAQVHIDEQLTLEARLTSDNILGDPSQREDPQDSHLPDESLALLFTCTHPAIPEADRLVLMLRYLVCLSAPEVAHVLLVPVPTVQQRLVRAKRRLRDSGISLAPPTASELPERLPSVLRSIYLLYTAGYARTVGAHHLQAEMTAEALRMSRALHRLLRHHTEVTGLLALLVLTESRAGGRVDTDGLPVPLPAQDRSRWDADLRAEGLALAESAATRAGASAGPAAPHDQSVRVGPYTVQATIAAVHAEAREYADTDWQQILALYDILFRITPTTVVEFNRAVAASKAHGAAEGLRRLDALASRPELQDHRAFHAARAITLAELGRGQEAARAYADALAAPGNASEDSFIERELSRLNIPSPARDRGC